MKERLFRLFNRKVVFYVLCFVFCIATLLTFWLARSTAFNDQGHYWKLAQGLHHGQFSSWYSLPVYTPETLRIWGYPFFLYLTQFVTDSYVVAQVIQLLLYFITAALALRIVKHFGKHLAYCSLLLIFLIFNNQLAFYTGILIAESLTIFLVTVFIYVYLFHKDVYRKYLLLALISFCMYQLRPVFLLFPLVLFFYHLFWRKQLRKEAFAYLGVFAVLLLPFGLWNKKAHGVFKITPLEGGMGAMHEGGYWDYRLPVGYTSNYYWGFTVDNDVLQPNFLSESEKQKAVVEYENFWNAVMKELNEKHRTPEDRSRAQYMTNEHAYRLGIFPQFSSTYTLAREKMMKDDLLKQIKANPGFYLKTRAYTFFRQWVIGIDTDKLKQSHSAASVFKVLYPCLVTFIFILCGLFFVLMQTARKKISFKQYHILFLFIFYCGIMNMPFVVISRYTVPVHLPILILLTIAIGNLLFKQSQKASAFTKEEVLNTA